MCSLPCATATWTTTTWALKFWTVISRFFSLTHTRDHACKVAIRLLHPVLCLNPVHNLIFDTLWEKGTHEGILYIVLLGASRQSAGSQREGSSLSRYSSLESRAWIDFFDTDSLFRRATITSSLMGRRQRQFWSRCSVAVPSRTILWITTSLFSATVRELCRYLWRHRYSSCSSLPRQQSLMLGIAGIAADDWYPARSSDESSPPPLETRRWALVLDPLSVTLTWWKHPFCINYMMPLLFYKGLGVWTSRGCYGCQRLEKLTVWWRHLSQRLRKSS